jgi:hypothetical protein
MKRSIGSLLRLAKISCWPRLQRLGMEASASCRLLANTEIRRSAGPEILTTVANTNGQMDYDPQPNP